MDKAQLKAKAKDKGAKKAKSGPPLSIAPARLISSRVPLFPPPIQDLNPSIEDLQAQREKIDQIILGGRSRIISTICVMGYPAAFPCL